MRMDLLTQMKIERLQTSEVLPMLLTCSEHDPPASWHTMPRCQEYPRILFGHLYHNIRVSDQYQISSSIQVLCMCNRPLGAGQSFLDLEPYAMFFPQGKREGKRLCKRMENLKCKTAYLLVWRTKFFIFTISHSFKLARNAFISIDQCLHTRKLLLRLKRSCSRPYNFHIHLCMLNTA